MPRSIDDILADPEVALAAKAYADKRVSAAIQTYAANHPSDETFTGRLAALEKTTDAKVAAMKLENYLLRACHKSGLDPDDVEELGMIFKDEADVDAKLSKLGEKVRKRDIAEMNEKLAGGFKPGSGNRVDGPKDPVAEARAAMSPEDRAALANRR